MRNFIILIMISPYDATLNFLTHRNHWDLAARVFAAYWHIACSDYHRCEENPGFHYES